MPEVTQTRWKWLKKLDVLGEVQNNILLGFFALILSLPPFFVLYHYTPAFELPIGNGLRIDHIVLFTAIFLLIFWLLKKFRLIFYGVIFLGLIAITFSGIFGGYNIFTLYRDYQAFVHSLQEGAVKIDFLERKEEFNNAERIQAAIDYKNPEVRKYAVNAASTHFQEYVDAADRTVIQSFSVFREVRKRWKYVHDPQFEEYYAKASETLELLDFDNSFKGDCDDYSILMAALVKSIGGKVRLVRTTVTQDDGRETGHIYPEVYVGDEKDLEMIAYLIREKLFEHEARNKSIYYYLGPNGDVWLNFDYNDYYPGGKYQSEIRDSEIEI